MGSFNGWREKIPMVGCHGDFSVIINLPPGVHQYKFIIDQKWRHDDRQAICTDSEGNFNNFVEVKPIVSHGTSVQPQSWRSSGDSLRNGSYGSLIEDLNGYSQLPTESRPNLLNLKEGSPPLLPPHLRKALLNESLVGANGNPIEEDLIIPLPPQVMLKHLYFLPREDLNLVIHGISERYRAKFVTTVFYKAGKSNGNDTGMIQVQ